MKTSKNQFVLIISDLLKLTWLAFLDFLGFNNSSVEKKLNYISDLWFLGRSNTSDTELFRVYIQNQIRNSEKRFNRYNSFLGRYYKYTFLFFALFLLIALLVNKFYNSKDLLVIANIILDFAIITYLILFWFNPSDKKKKATFRLLEILREVYSEKNPLDFFRSKKYNTTEKKITLPFINSELAAVFGSLFLSGQFKGLSQTQVADFIQNKCIQVNGNSYTNMEVLISQYKRDHIIKETALNNFYDKLKQNTIE